MKVVLRGLLTTLAATSATTRRVHICTDLHLLPASPRSRGSGHPPIMPARVREQPRRVRPEQHLTTRPGLQRAGTGDPVRTTRQPHPVSKTQCREEGPLGCAPKSIVQSAERVASPPSANCEEESACKVVPATDGPVDS